MTKEELKTATAQELIEQRDYCGVDGYHNDYLQDVSEEMLNRFNRLAELEEEKCELLGIIQGKDKAIQDLQKEIKLLGERCNQLLADKGKLKDELDKWKSEWNEQVIKANEEGFARIVL
jgi:predicted nuclease with TOPRIM domain